MAMGGVARMLFWEGQNNRQGFDSPVEGGGCLILKGMCVLPLPTFCSGFLRRVTALITPPPPPSLSYGPAQWLHYIAFAISGIISIYM